MSFSQVEIELESVRVQLEEESEARLDLERQLVKSNGEAMQWRSKYETEAAARAEEIEEIRRKYSCRIQEQEEQIETLIIKINNIEKQKSRLQSEVRHQIINILATFVHDVYRNLGINRSSEIHIPGKMRVVNNSEENIT